MSEYNENEVIEYVSRIVFEMWSVKSCFRTQVTVCTCLVFGKGRGEFKMSAHSHEEGQK